jgi:hypothetical protein
MKRRRKIRLRSNKKSESRGSESRKTHSSIIMDVEQR